jgi:drug/metabolite transporter (DMT)-like permease
LTPAEPKPITLSAALLATLCSALWGGLAVAIRYTQDDLPPLATAGVRFGLAAVFMAAWAWHGGESLKIRSGQAMPIVVAGLLLFAQIGTFHLGLTQTNSAHASVLIGSHPVIVAILAHYVLHGDRLSRIKLAGLLLSTLGLIAVVMGDQLVGAASTAAQAGGDPATLTGDGVILFSSFLLGVATVNTKWALSRVSAGPLLFWSYLLASAGFLGCSFVWEPLAEARLDWVSAAGLVYQTAVVSGFCFAAWTSLLRRHRASQLSVFAFGQPLFGMLFGRLMRDDALTVWLALGGVGIALGILLVTREAPKSK